MNTNTKILTLEEFRATGRDADVGALTAGYSDPDNAIIEDDEHRAGRVYAGGCYLEENEGPQGKYHATEPYYCTIGNDSRGGTLAEMEEFLYNDWYLVEVAYPD